MKQKTIVLIVLAVVCGLGASFMTSKLLAERSKDEETVKVLVAKKKLDTGLLIKKPEDYLEEADMPKEKALKGALTKLEEAKGRQLKIPRREGDQITQDDLFDQNNLNLSGILPPGHRAVGIRVSPENIAAGFAALPHSRVDITCSQRGDRNNNSRILLQNVLVLAAGKETMRNEEGKAMPCDVVTVALLPEDALKLSVARGKGGLDLLLRPFGDTAVVKAAPQNDETVFNTNNQDGKNTDLEGTRKELGAVPDLNVPFASGQQAPPVNLVKEKDAVVKPLVQWVKNGSKWQKVIYEVNEDGQYETRWENVEPKTPTTPTPAQSNPGAPANPGATAAPRPGPAAGPAAISSKK